MAAARRGVSMKRRRLIVLAVLIAAVATLVYQLTRHDVPAGQPALATLDASTLSSLRADFNAAAGQTRIIVLLAPT
jgi:hypothetical protein